MHVCVYIYIYIYIYREREREIMCICLSIYLSIYLCETFPTRAAGAFGLRGDGPPISAHLPDPKSRSVTTILYYTIL